jgi:hypothetical protein
VRPKFKLMLHLVYFSVCASEMTFIAFKHQREKATSVSLNVLFNDTLHCQDHAALVIEK